MLVVGQALLCIDCWARISNKDCSTCRSNAASPALIMHDPDLCEDRQSQKRSEMRQKQAAEKEADMVAYIRRQERTEILRLKREIDLKVREEETKLSLPAGSIYYVNNDLSSWDKKYPQGNGKILAARERLDQEARIKEWKIGLPSGILGHFI